MEHKNPEELAAEITIAALSGAQGSLVNYGPNVAAFYRTIYKEIAYFISKPFNALDVQQHIEEL